MLPRRKRLEENLWSRSELPRTGTRPLLAVSGPSFQRFSSSLNDRFWEKADIKWLHKNSDIPALFRQRPDLQLDRFSTIYSVA